jgi:hypothetical protein
MRWVPADLDEPPEYGDQVLTEPPWIYGEVVGGTMPETAQLVYLWVEEGGARYALTDLGEVYGSDAHGAPISRAAMD